MCSRFGLFRSKQEIMDELVPLLWDQGLDYAANWNITPTTTIPVLMLKHDQRTMTGMQWGLVPSWRKTNGQPLINARMETLSDKPSFRTLVGTQQCIIPMDGYFEWKKEGTIRRPYFIQRDGGRLLLAAGLWEMTTGADGTHVQVTMITRSPTQQLATIHNRMPYLMTHAAADAWIRGGELEQPSDALTFSLTTTSVSTAVNSVHASGPECIEPGEQQMELF